MPKSKQRIFSATAAVKANARERIGTPPPQVPLPGSKAVTERRASKHKITLQKLLQRQEDR